MYIYIIVGINTCIFVLLLVIIQIKKFINRQVSLYFSEYKDIICITQKNMEVIMTKCIAIANQKGGVAKTTLTYNIVHLLASEGKKTLVLDLDSQCSLGKIMRARAANADLFSVLNETVSYTDAIVNIVDHLDMLVGGVNLASYDALYGQDKDREVKLKKVIDRIKESNEYDYIVLDTPPGLSVWMVSAIVDRKSVV